MHRSYTFFSDSSLRFLGVSCPSYLLNYTETKGGKSKGDIFFFICKKFSKAE